MSLRLTHIIILFIAIACFACGAKEAQPKPQDTQDVKPSSMIIEETDSQEDADSKANNEADSKAEDGAGDMIEDQEGDKLPPEQIEKAKQILASVSDKDVEAVDANKLFRMHCAICHGFKGNMKINGAKDLTLSKISVEESVAQVYHGKGLMTPYKGILSEAEIVALAKYVESFRKKG